nr:HK97 family phage prohead protease [uncultured Dysosmobacter sp.]
MNPARAVPNQQDRTGKSLQLERAAERTSAKPDPVKADKSKGTRELTDCSIRALEGEGNERKFTISFSSEEPYERWFGQEILDHSEGSVDLNRLNSIGCVLFNHDRDKVVGKILRAWIENNRGYAEIEFDTDEKSETIYQKVKTGTLKGVSVSYKVDNWEEVMPNKQSQDGRFTGPCSIARKWAPYEVSIVSVPADPTVGVGRSDAEEGTQERAASMDYYERQLQINKNYMEVSEK